MLTSINSYMRKKITKKLEDNGVLPTAQAIANYWVLAGKPTVDNDYDYKIWNNNKMNSLQN